ncbi:MAG TPA: hypothetical protein VMS63_07300 [Gaiellaceae bacterium]|nr:hypothetical protein [Gaiellaceae bacterium]
MVDDQTRRRTRRGIAPLLALAGVVVLLAAGCGKSADQKANEAYANSVCTAIAGWKTQVKSIATDLSGGISQATFQSKVTQVESATKSVVTQIQAIPPPDTSQGQATKQQLDQLSAELKTTAASVKTASAALPADASAGTVAVAVLALAPQVKSLATTAQSTITALQSSKGALSSAFKSTDSCKSVSSSG